MTEPRYRMCRHCDHFVEGNSAYDEVHPNLAAYIHLEDGDQEFDHDADPGRWPDDGWTLAWWREREPDLFFAYPDGKIGPNSKFHNRRGKNDTEGSR
jgi:hypothetical protein